MAHVWFARMYTEMRDLNRTESVSSTHKYTALCFVFIAIATNVEITILMSSISSGANSRSFLMRSAFGIHVHGVILSISMGSGGSSGFHEP